MLLTGTSPATCRDEEVSQLQISTAGPEEDGLTGLPSSFADTPEVLRKADGHAQSATIGENFDSGLFSA